jgi:hypothetical protein
LRKKVTVEQLTDSTYTMGQEFQECAYEKCAWYDQIHECCIMRHLADLAKARETSWPAH